MASQNQTAATRTCGACRGSGKQYHRVHDRCLDSAPCPTCAGSGRVPGNKPATTRAETSVTR